MNTSVHSSIDKRALEKESFPWFLLGLPSLFPAGTLTALPFLSLLFEWQVLSIHIQQEYLKTFANCL